MIGTVTGTVICTVIDVVTGAMIGAVIGVVSGAVINTVVGTMMVRVISKVIGMMISGEEALDYREIRRCWEAENRQLGNLFSRYLERKNLFFDRDNN